jgi:hypothetical protein
MHAGQLEVRLDAVFRRREVLGHPGRTGRHGHFAVGGLEQRIGQRGAFQVFGYSSSMMFIWVVLMATVT